MPTAPDAAFPLFVPGDRPERFEKAGDRPDSVQRFPVIGLRVVDRIDGEQTAVAKAPKSHCNTRRLRSIARTTAPRRRAIALSR